MRPIVCSLSYTEFTAIGMMENMLSVDYKLGTTYKFRDWYLITRALKHYLSTGREVALLDQQC